MNWLTTHYPHPNPDTHPWHIYLQRDHRDAVNGIQIGDRVFFYEFANQKPIKGSPKFPAGRQGIVRVAFVSGPICSRDVVIEHTDDSTVHWGWSIPTERDDADGFVSRLKLCEILEYKGGYKLRGFENGTGIKRLDDDVAAQLYNEFKSYKKRD